MQLLSHFQSEAIPYAHYAFIKGGAKSLSYDQATNLLDLYNNGNLSPKRKANILERVQNRIPTGYHLEPTRLNPNWFVLIPDGATQ